MRVNETRARLRLSRPICPFILNAWVALCFQKRQYALSGIFVKPSDGLIGAPFRRPSIRPVINVPMHRKGDCMLASTRLLHAINHAWLHCACRNKGRPEIKAAGVYLSVWMEARVLCYIRRKKALPGRRLFEYRKRCRGDDFLSMEQTSPFLSERLFGAFYSSRNPYRMYVLGVKNRCRQIRSISLSVIRIISPSILIKQTH